VRRYIMYAKGILFKYRIKYIIFFFLLYNKKSQNSERFDIRGIIKACVNGASLSVWPDAKS